MIERMLWSSYICQDKGVLVARFLVVSALHLFSGSRATGKFCIIII